MEKKMNEIGRIFMGYKFIRVGDKQNKIETGGTIH